MNRSDESPAPSFQLSAGMLELYEQRPELWGEISKGLMMRYHDDQFQGVLEVEGIEVEMLRCEVSRRIEGIQALMMGQQNQRENANSWQIRLRSETPIHDEGLGHRYGSGPYENQEGTWVSERRVLRSGSGYYLGRLTELGPHSRESEAYFPTIEEASEALETGEFTFRAHP